MKQRKAILILIILGIAALSGILAIQYYWIKHVNKLHEAEVSRQQQQQSLLADEFNDRVKVSLSNVAQQILDINDDPAEIYQAVEQLSSNYFVVRMNDTLHPYLLENLLIREFKKNSVEEEFQYGIYDCFTDSIQYGKIISQDSSISNTEIAEAPPEINWDNDGHYFSVRFPERENIYIEEAVEIPDTWALSAVAVVLVFIFFGYALFTIIREKKISEIRNDFIGNMTHELKTPISTIGLSSEMISKLVARGEHEKVERYASVIRAENKRLEAQVEQVLQIARLEKSGIRLNKESVSLHSIITETAESFELIAQQQNGSIQVDLKADTDMITGDKVHITQVLSNLLDNALKYNEGEPKVTVSTINQEDGIVIEVADNGIGFGQDQAKKIFDKFYRVPKGNVHDVKGFGLGLYYVRILVEQHGGTINCESVMGSGSVFRIWLPLMEKQ